MTLAEKIRLGFAVCGSFCTFKRVLEELEKLAKEYDITPIMSSGAAFTDTRFGKAEDLRRRITEICGKEPITTIAGAEPIGPQALLDVLVIEPCTGNTLGKLANGITDTAVTMAAKAHLRNGRPVVLAVSTNDALGASARNIGTLMNAKNIYFVPMRQDAPQGKPASVVANFAKTGAAIKAALEGKQVQPVLVQ
ncbi:MAG: dipicolinate synthase subunit B [Oscillospiraceae bacterium]|nr:dipicolinate synthase subunit B [Oscillospiraceae bacterium]